MTHLVNNDTYPTNGEGWIQHDGGKCPVDDETEVQASSWGGWTVTAKAGALKWHNVAAYRVVKP